MKLRKLLAMVLCVAMVLGTMTTVAFAEDTAAVNNTEQLAEAVLIPDSNHVHAVRFDGVGGRKDELSNKRVGIEVKSNKTIILHPSDSNADGHVSVIIPLMGPAWNSIPNPSNGVITLNAGETLDVIKTYWAEYYPLDLGHPGYNELFTQYKGLSCGLYFTPSFIKNNKDLEVEVSLKLYTMGSDGTIASSETIASSVYSTSKVAIVDGGNYSDADAAFAALKDGSVIKLLDDVTPSGEVTLPANVTIQGNGKAINANVVASGDVTFEEYTKITNFNAGYNKPTITIGKGATLEITGTGRMVIGHGATFNITGDFVNAKTAHTQQYTPSLIMPGASFTGAGVTFNVTNAYIKTTASYCSSSKTASGNFVFNITNSVWEQFDKFAMEAQSVNATCDFNLKDSVMTTTSHLVFGLTGGNVVIDNSNVNVGTSRQIENRGNMLIKNGSVVNGAVATSSNAKNPGTITVDNAEYTVTGEFSGAAEGRGKLVLQNDAIASVGTVSKADIELDATSKLTVTNKVTPEATIKVDVENIVRGNSIKVLDTAKNTKEEIEAITTVESAPLVEPIFDGGDIELVAEPLSTMIGTEYYGSLQAALDAANDGDVITLLLDVSDESFTIDKSVTIQSNNKARAISKTTLNNVKFTMGSGVEFTVKDLKFTGNSYINANNGAALTVTNCDVDVDPAKITGRSAFIVTGTAELNNVPLKLVVTDNVILSAKSSKDYYGAAIFGWRYLADGTTISNNTFGSATDRYNFVVVKTMNAMPDATFVIENNTVYGTNQDWYIAAFDMYQNNSRDNAYTVISKSNVIDFEIAPGSTYDAAAFVLEGNNGTNVVVLDNGTTVNGEAITMADFDTSSLPSNYNKFYGVNVELDEDGKIIAGNLSSIPADSYLSDEFYAEALDGSYLVTPKAASAINVVLKATSNPNVYDIVLESADSYDIYEFVSAELTFANASTTVGNNNSAMQYSISGIAGETFAQRAADADKKDQFIFSILEDGTRLSGDSFVIGQVTFEGQGTVNFAVADGKVATTKQNTHLGKYYTTEVGDETLKIDLAKIEGGKINEVKRNVAVNIAFNHNIVADYWNNNMITVTIKDGFGNVDTKDVAITNNAGICVFENVKLGRLTVTVEGKGFRKYVYETTLEEGNGEFVLNFWNDVKRVSAEVIETGKFSMFHNFLVGDIVMDYVVDEYDLAAVTSYYGTYNIDKTEAAKYIKYDLNRDGNIDIIDVQYVLHTLNN